MFLLMDELSSIARIISNPTKFFELTKKFPTLLILKSIYASTSISSPVESTSPIFPPRIFLNVFFSFLDVVLLNSISSV